MVDTRLFRMFAADEMSVLLSGQSRVNVADLRSATVYTNGYTESHEVIRVRSFT